MYRIDWTTLTSMNEHSPRDTVEGTLGVWAIDYDVDALTFKYRCAIARELPPDHQLLQTGIVILGPVDNESNWAMAVERLKGIIDDVDFWALAEQCEHFPYRTTQRTQWKAAE